MEPILQEIRQEVAEAGYQMEVTYQKDRPLLHTANKEATDVQVMDATDISYIDDVLVMMVFDDTELMEAELCRITRFIQQKFKERGLALNFNAGKTEVMISFAGRNSADARHRMLAELQSKLDLGEGQTLRIVESYKHLGVQHASTRQMSRIVQEAVNTFEKAFHEFKPDVFVPKKVSRRSKLRALDICIAKACFSAQVWLPIPDHLLDKLERIHLKAVRTITNTSYRELDEARFHNDDLYAFGILGIHTILKLKRLAYFPRLVKHGPIQLHALVQMTSQLPGSWATQMRKDLRWAWQATDKLATLEDPLIDDNLQAWQDFARDHSKEWHAIMKIIKRNIEEGKVFDLRAEPSPQADIQGHYCRACDRTFTCAQAYNLHCHYRHNRRSAGTLYALADARCACCLKQYANRQRLIQHLSSGYIMRGAGSCLAQMWLADLPVAPAEQRRRLDEADRVQAATNRRKGCHRAHASMPTLQLSGPRGERRYGPVQNLVDFVGRLI
eukprot:TRINITY_DN30922_c1_g2_i1.p1 TRINITY_DN30922_c1_g2~~TRINITY_DN30922_c1_g2_i1.p1  ORF type:complete len:547 (+),score=91.46 TRINITY_DN30922_c1_g2_i1:144-1643(+)